MKAKKGKGLKVEYENRLIEKNRVIKEEENANILLKEEIVSSKKVNIQLLQDMERLKQLETQFIKNAKCNCVLI